MNEQMPNYDDIKEATRCKFDYCLNKTDVF